MSTYTTLAKDNPRSIELELSAEGKSNITVTPPPEFKGSATEWSPEDLFSASISTCFLLTFKVLASFKRLTWEELEVKAVAHLEKTSTGFKFTRVDIKPKIKLTRDANVDLYIKLFEKAKNTCLVTQSMNCEFHVEPMFVK